MGDPSTKVTMGNLGADTELESTGEDTYQVTLSDDWAMWGPNGGYLAAVALRAAGRSAMLARPATLTCSFLGTATFDPAEMRVTRLRGGKRAELLRVEMFQGGSQIIDATVWAVADGLPGPERQWDGPPDAPEPSTLPTMTELVTAAGGRPLPLWRNYEVRPATGMQVNGERPAGDAKTTLWLRFLHQATFPDNVWLDAGRCAIAADISGFPTVAQGFAASEMAFVAPTMDLHLTFHGTARPGEWLLLQSEGLGTGGGLAGARARIFSPGAGLVASGGQQMLVTQPKGRTVPHSAGRQAT